MQFYKRDPDRALAGMAELTLQERGAYNTIIDALYSRDGQLPDDDEILRRLMGCHGNEWRAVKARLIAKGKVWIEGGYIKAKRVDEVLEEAAGFSEKQRKRAAKRWETPEKQPGNARETAGKRAGNSEIPQENQHNGYACEKMPLTPTPTPTPKEETPKPPKGGRGVDEAQFEEWYSEYPRKVAKGKARRAFKGAMKKADLATLIAGARSYAKLVSGKERQYVAHPSTWLNGERWLDRTAEQDRAEQASPAHRADTARDWLTRHGSIPSWMDDREIADILIGEGYDYEKLRAAGFSLPPSGNVVHLGDLTGIIGPRRFGGD